MLIKLPVQIFFDLLILIVAFLCNTNIPVCFFLLFCITNSKYILLFLVAQE